jgi:enoyl-[acyl-carrier-protein] reductase (NADH)
VLHQLPAMAWLPTHTRCAARAARRYSYANAPVQKELAASEVGAAAAFLVSPLASAITGQVVYVDNGLSTMGLAMDSAALLPRE